MSNHIDHDVRQFIVQSISSFGRIMEASQNAAFAQIFQSNPHLRIDIASPQASVNDDVKRVQDLRELGIEDDLIKNHVIQSSSALDSSDKEKYAETVMLRAQTLERKNGLKEEISQQTIRENERELAL
jgi:hypothetical protein